MWLLRLEGPIEADTGPVDSLRDTPIELQGQLIQEGIVFDVIGAKVRSKFEVTR